ncbi:EPSP synthase-domain-containing protein [Lipomyces doorenjongii]
MEMRDDWRAENTSRRGKSAGIVWTQTSSVYLSDIWILTDRASHVRCQTANNCSNLVDALRSNSACIEYLESVGSLPLRITAGKHLKGGRVELAATVSSQYVSAVLMCAPYAESPTTLALVGGKPVSQSYIDMTIAMMASFGVKVTKSSTEEHSYEIPKATAAGRRPTFALRHLRQTVLVCEAVSLNLLSDSLKPNLRVAVTYRSRGSANDRALTDLHSNCTGFSYRVVERRRSNKMTGGAHYV